MPNVNKTFLMGNVTRDPELRTTQGGTAVCKFGMAINRKYKQGDEQKESTCFVDLVAWGRQAEVIAQYVKKGSPLFVEGRLEFSSWEDKQGGGKRSKLEVAVENFQLMGDKPEGGRKARGQRDDGYPTEEDSGVPF